MILGLCWSMQIFMESKFGFKINLKNVILKQIFKYFFRSSFSEFAQKYGKDDRFRIIEKIRERESLFNEFIVEIRKKEKDDKIHKKEQVSQNFIYSKKRNTFHLKDEFRTCLNKLLDFKIFFTEFLIKRKIF